jgi:hypothetical protein
MTVVVLKVNMKNIEWGKCLYVNVTHMIVVLKVNMKNIEWERNVYVNVTYDCGSQSEYEKHWVR